MGNVDGQVIQLDSWRAKALVGRIRENDGDAA